MKIRCPCLQLPSLFGTKLPLSQQPGPACKPLRVGNLLAAPPPCYMDGAQIGSMTCPKVSAANGSNNLGPSPPPNSLLLHPAVPTGRCVTALFCCASRRGFTWAESMYGGTQGGGGRLGLPFPWGQRALQHPWSFSFLGWVLHPLRGPAGTGLWSGRGNIGAPFHSHLLLPPCSASVPRPLGGPSCSL